MVCLKKIFFIIIQIGLLYVLFYIGETIQQTFQLFIPGSVIGLILLFLLLMSGLMPLRFIEQGASFMTRHLVLFFIPATVGMMQYYELFIGEGMSLLALTIVGTVLVMVVSGIVSQKLAERKE